MYIKSPRSNSWVTVGDNNPEVAKCISPSQDNCLFGNVYTNTIQSRTQGKQLHQRDSHPNEFYAEGDISVDGKVKNDSVGQTK